VLGKPIGDRLGHSDEYRVDQEIHALGAVLLSDTLTESFAAPFVLAAVASAIGFWVALVLLPPRMLKVPGRL
jgi:hypothetical protein